MGEWYTWNDECNAARTGLQGKGKRSKVIMERVWLRDNVNVQDHRKFSLAVSAGHVPEEVHRIRMQASVVHRRGHEKTGCHACEGHVRARNGGKVEEAHESRRIERPVRPWLALSLVACVIAREDQRSEGVCDCLRGRLQCNRWKDERVGGVVGVTAVGRRRRRRRRRRQAAEPGREEIASAGL